LSYLMYSIIAFSRSSFEYMRTPSHPYCLFLESKFLSACPFGQFYFAKNTSWFIGVSVTSKRSLTPLSRQVESMPTSSFGGLQSVTYGALRRASPGKKPSKVNRVGTVPRGRVIVPSEITSNVSV